MPPDERRVLVVGTTADYVDWMRRRPGEVLFLTDAGVRHKALEPAPLPHEEILCDLAHGDQAEERLADHLAGWGIGLSGVACFDDESMALAARLARVYGLPYPSPEAVANCRDKHRAKTLWRSQGLATPAAAEVASPAAARAFFRQTGGPVVLKPTGGSGSELIFRCDSEADCIQAYSTIAEGLADRKTQRLYHLFAGDGGGIMAEGHIAGEEYSCDFVLEDGRATVLRLTGKVRFPQDPFGTAKAYSLSGIWPEGIDRAELEALLARAARALGLERALGMLDFFVHDGRIILLEMAPRPGGDCLPWLLRCGWGLDVLALTLDFACRRPLAGRLPSAPSPMVGLRLHADREGVLSGLDDDALRRDPRVREIHLTRRPGHRIKRPPADYDAWLLGHLLFVPAAGEDIAAQCRDLHGRLIVRVA